MFTTVLFDMGGTLENISYSSESMIKVTDNMLKLLEKYGIQVNGTKEEFWSKVKEGKEEYRIFSEANQIELKPEEIWPNWVMKKLDLNKEKIAEISEELAHMWEVTYFERKLRDGVIETLEKLKNKGYKLGIISNTASLYQVFDVLEDYGIRDYFKDVTLSSITGYRKPNKEIFNIALNQMQAKPEECVYVGDTRSRDITGAKNANFGASIQIKSFLTQRKDAEVEKAIQPDFIISDITEVVTVMEELEKR
ncbi:HAD family hydrolase [Anaerosacchariphilus polymeriproducens]|uniref:HAD family hydrolase n=1 Tax=Anaerosacchariphilus polymeriproducens TaxID=1812858 RepID=A0A371AVM7_9FIRM|nr:HAD family hydrolase [Anaerosacchariphilus polymeriproducens]RDU23644.1 HAD family hydrolase [Anaerosacchariphilus polymeriproducens]